MSQVDEEKEVRQEGRGRSAQKRAAKAIEQLAQNLTEIPDTELAQLHLEPGLAREVSTARNTRGHSSRKRQIKHLAGYLRKHEASREAVEAALAGQAVSQRQETLAFHHLEDLRDRICNTETFVSAMAEVRSRHPRVDADRLTRLATSVHETGDKKAAREIFRRLRKAAEDSSA